MFKVDDVVLSEDIATSRFTCDVTRCKGACCVVGDAGAPVDKSEVAVLQKAYRQLKHRLSPEAVQVADAKGVVQKSGKDSYEITCIDAGDCIFVEKDSKGVASCAIQNAFYKGEFNWEKPISCHLYPVRLKKISGMEFANFEYIPDLCSAGCRKGDQNGTYLAEFLEKALKRRYGTEWYQQFLSACYEIRSNVQI